MELVLIVQTCGCLASGLLVECMTSARHQLQWFMIEVGLRKTLPLSLLS